MANRKLIKVQFTYEEEDGSQTVSTLQGDAQEWFEIINGYAVFHQIRQGQADSRLEKFTWKDEPKTSGAHRAAVVLGRRGGLKGGKARAEKLSEERRKEIAKKAANVRWKEVI